MLGAILKQLVGRGDIPDHVRQSFREGKKEVGGRKLLLADLVRMLKVAIASLPQVFICIDALDECLPKNLPEFLGSLRDITQESRSTRIFLTGRPHVKESIQRYFAKIVVIPINPNTEDIRNFLEMRLEKDDEPDAMNNELRADIVRVILDKMSDMWVTALPLNHLCLPTIVCRFLLVSLNIDAILGEVTIRQRRKKLEEMMRGNGLSDAYIATLTRLKAQKGNKPGLGLKVLMWVLYSERPLRAEELCHALGVEVGSSDLDLECVPSLRTLLSSCLGLVTIEVSSSTLRLVHFTLQEHLLRDPALFYNPHSTIAEACLTYLNSTRVCELSPLPPTPVLAPPEMPLLEYASLYWGNHAKKGVTENVRILALRLLDRFDEHPSAPLLLLPYFKATRRRIWFNQPEQFRGFTGLHGVVFLGVVEIFLDVLKMKEWDVNAADCMGRTPLAWAAERGYEEVVEMLLDRGDVNPNQAVTFRGQTPLWLACYAGHEGVVKLLLGREDVNPNQADTNYGQEKTPLWQACSEGHEGVVKLILGREDVNPNQADTEYGRTPFSQACYRGHEGVAKLLLEREDVNPNQADTEYGATPFSLAARGGHKGIVQMLLQRQDINPDHPGTKYGRTPFSQACYHGHEGVVKLLLEREDVNPSQADTRYGRTPLWQACSGGHEGVVKLLLEREDVNPTQADTEYYQTPLWRACYGGHEGVVKLLLEREDVNPNQADTDYNRTPLWVACFREHEGVVKLLLGREDVNPNQADPYFSQTPLWLACSEGHEGVVKLILGREDINPNQADTDCGQTPLCQACSEGHEGVVKLLLEREDLNPNQADTKYGRTPLAWAVHNRVEGILKLLLERQDVNPGKADTKSGATPLLLAVESRHEGIIEMLLEREDVDPNQPDTEYGATPFLLAARRGYKGIVQMLLQRQDIDPNNPDTKFGRTPLEWAAEGGHEDVVKAILERSAIPPAMPDHLNQTPQLLASSQGHDAVVSLLPEQISPNSDTASRAGQTPPHSSARAGAECVVEMQFTIGQNTDPTDRICQPALLSPGSHVREPVLDPKNSGSMSHNNDPPATEPLNLSPPPSMWPLKLSYPVVGRYWIIAAFICLLALFAYLLPASLLDSFSLKK